MKTLVEEHPAMVSEESRPLVNYYRWHARIYDATRWAFLFGRNGILDAAAAEISPTRILEIGCGTGKNLEALALRFPDAAIVGLDLSADMLDCARPKLARFGDRISLLHQRYDAPVSEGEKFDLVVCSYALSMIHPGSDEVIAHSGEDLSDSGLMAVVDFHDSPAAWFRRWMGVNHVVMEGQILEQLEKSFETVRLDVIPAYAGLWRYLSYLGRYVR
jgi:S-adenosylmethionine-diacylgycerolhomoserine-N-methlytransferase